MNQAGYSESTHAVTGNTKKPTVESCAPDHKCRYCRVKIVKQSSHRGESFNWHEYRCPECGQQFLKSVVRRRR